MTPREDLTSVIIPCWNALELTRVCLGQVLKWTTAPFELIVVDNGSIDATPSWLKALKKREAASRRNRALARIRIIRNPRNRGYPKAMNQGIRAARGRRLLFGNGDAAVGPFWLEGMLAALKSRPGIGGVSPIANLPPPGLEAPLTGGWRHPPYYDGIPGLENFAAAVSLRHRDAEYRPAAEFIPGFWFLADAQAIESVGPFDERYSPGGGEDLDLQWRLRRRGLTLGFAPQVYVHHLWFGCSRRNGLRAKDLYGPPKNRLFIDKFPDVRGLGLEILGARGETNRL